MKAILKILGGILALVVIAVGVLAALYWEADIPLDTLKAKYTNDESEFVTMADGLEVHMRDQGPEDGEVLVFVHGSNASLHTWEPWISMLKDQYRCISITLAGHGLTGPDPADDYSMIGQAQLVHEVLQSREIERYTIIGSSMGGFVSWAHTLLYPESVDRLVLIGASGFPRENDNPPLAFKLMASPVLGPLLKNITPRSIVESAVSAAYNSSPMISEELIDRYFDMTLREGNREATAIRFSQPRDMEMYTRLDEIGVPTLIMWGEKDALVPVGDADKFDAAIQRSKKVIYPDLGHIPFEEAPKRTVMDLQAFLNGELGL